MSHYAPSLTVSSWTTLQRVRELPVPGAALVAVGDSVRADQPVLRAELPGEVAVVRVASQLGIEPVDVLKQLRIKVGDEVQCGQLVAEYRSFFGLFVSSCKSPVTGIVEFFTESNGHIGVRGASSPLQILAYVDGCVVEVDPKISVTIETKGALLQGIFGVGGERIGEIFSLPFPIDNLVEPDALALITDDLTGKILVGGSRFSHAALMHAADRKVAGIVTGSTDSDTLRKYIGFELGVSITGDEDVPFPLVITEGFGQLSLSSRVVDWAKPLHGKRASINGTTQVRAGAIRPELIVALEQSISDIAVEIDPTLRVGARVRLIRVPYFGLFGTITDLPAQPEVIPSGAHVRVLKAKLEDGREVTIPRANVELL